MPFRIREMEELFQQRPPDQKTPGLSKPSLVIEDVEATDEVVEISKDFIVKLSTEINDIGNYL